MLDGTVLHASAAFWCSVAVGESKTWSGLGIVSTRDASRVGDGEAALERADERLSFYLRSRSELAWEEVHFHGSMVGCHATRVAQCCGR